MKLQNLSDESKGEALLCISQLRNVRLLSRQFCNDSNTEHVGLNAVGASRLGICLWLWLKQIQLDLAMPFLAPTNSSISDMVL